MPFSRRVDEIAPFRIALLAGCVLAAALALPAAPALAGCNSGNNANTALLGSSGCQADAGGASATAVGSGAEATGIEATAVGALSDATGDFSVAVGAGADATGTAATAVGDFAVAESIESSAFGAQAAARGERSAALGFGAGFNSGNAPGYTALGTLAGTGYPLGAFSTTIGGSNSFGVNNPRALGAYSIAIGGGNSAIDFGARANNDHAVAIGTGSIAQGVQSLAVGPFAGGGTAGAGNQHNLAVGAKAGVTVNGSFNAAFGDNAGGVVTGMNNVALGRNAGRSVTASNTVAVGTNAQATGTTGIAIGNNAKSTANQAIAIGNASQATVANTVSVGSASIKRRIMNVANAVAANDAVNLAQAKTLAAVAQAQAADDIRRELAELRALVKQQQQEIAELKGRAVTAAARD